MLNAITLLVSRDPQTLRLVQQAHDGCDLLRLEICGPIEKAHTRLQRDEMVLVLIDLSADLADKQVRLFLREAATCTRATIALLCSEEAATPAARALLQEGAVDLLCLPSDSGKLVQLMNDTSRRQTAGATSIANEVAPEPRSSVTVERTEEHAQIRRVAAQDTTILLTGETGTGKTLLARQIHDASPRKDRPFLVVDCGALSASLIESEIFGHIRGSFTGADKERIGKFAAAGDGTLVLDEINSLPMALQAKLLRAVEERVFEQLGSNHLQPVRARLIAISNVPLEQEVTSERFRPDLFYRLNVFGFRLPPLRERWSDILPLARRFLADHPVARTAGIVAFSPEAVQAMQAYSWPGNVRELRNVIERVAALTNGPVVALGDLPEAIRRPAVTSPSVSSSAAPVTSVRLGAIFEPAASPEDEVWRICEALRKHGNNRVRAAAELGMSRVSLYKKLHKYGLFQEKMRVGVR
jgi:DNA-binding NtrC family response regulator